MKFKTLFLVVLLSIFTAVHLEVYSLSNVEEDTPMPPYPEFGVSGTWIFIKKIENTTDFNPQPSEYLIFNESHRYVGYLVNICETGEWAHWNMTDEDRALFEEKGPYFWVTTDFDPVLEEHMKQYPNATSFWDPDYYKYLLWEPTGKFYRITQEVDVVAETRSSPRTTPFTDTLQNSINIALLGAWIGIAACGYVNHGKKRQH